MRFSISSIKKVKIDVSANKISDDIHGTPIYDDNGKYAFVNSTNLENGKIIITSAIKKLTKEEYIKHKRALNDNTILTSINGTIGKVAY